MPSRDDDDILLIDIPNPCTSKEVTENLFWSGLEKVEVDSQGNFSWPRTNWIWQDFLPCLFNSCLSFYVSSLPTLIELVPEIENLKDGAYWFNFVFDWWFTVPVHTAVDSNADADDSKLPWPCNKCKKRFKQEWEVSKHYIAAHLPTQAPAPPPKTPAPPSPSPPPLLPEEEELPEIILPPPVKEKTPEEEIYLRIFDPLDDPIYWRWEDFLPDWSTEFLPSPYYQDFDSLDIFDPDPEPVPVAPKRPPARVPVPEPEVRKVFELRVPAPVLKQTKYFCKTCSLTICNSCFTRGCSAHNVDWMGQAKFACGAC